MASGERNCHSDDSDKRSCYNYLCQVADVGDMACNDTEDRRLYGRPGYFGQWCASLACGCSTSTYLESRVAMYRIITCHPALYNYSPIQVASFCCGILKKSMLY